MITTGIKQKSGNDYTESDILTVICHIARERIYEYIPHEWRTDFHGLIVHRGDILDCIDGAFIVDKSFSVSIKVSQGTPNKLNNDTIKALGWEMGNVIWIKLLQSDGDFCMQLGTRNSVRFAGDIVRPIYTCGVITAELIYGLRVF